MTDPASIRDLFLHPRPAYSIAEAAAVLAMDWREVRGWVESGELEGVETDQGLVVPWSELVSFGMDFWSQEVVEEALGGDVAEAIPELLRLTELQVRIPRMQVVTWSGWRRSMGSRSGWCSRGSCGIWCPSTRSGCRGRWRGSRRRWRGRKARLLRSAG